MITHRPLQRTCNHRYTTPIRNTCTGEGIDPSLTLIKVYIQRQGLHTSSVPIDPACFSPDHITRLMLP